MTKDEYFIDLARAVSQRSKDPSTKCGTVIVDAAGRVVATGYNGFAQRMPDNEANYANREEKYDRIIHAEMNAVIFAKQDLAGCTVYTWPFLSCNRCAVHLVQAGVSRLVAPLLTGEAAERWEPSFKKTRSYLAECGVECCEVIR